MRAILTLLSALALVAPGIAGVHPAPARASGAPLAHATPARPSPRALTATASPRVNLKIIARFTIRGRLELPPGVSAANGCRGSVSIRALMRWHHVTLSTITTRLHRSCHYKAKLVLGTQGLLRRDVQILASFGGNAVLLPKEARPVLVTVA